MHRLFRIKAYEAEHGPHFDEEMARKAVSKMENEDGSRGQLRLIFLQLLHKFKQRAPLKKEPKNLQLL